MAHLTQGTFRPHRHGPRPVVTHGAVALAPVADPEWQPDLTALGPAGAAFVGALTQQFSFGIAEGTLAMEAGHLIDRLEQLRAEIPTLDPAARLGAMRLEVGLSGRLAGTILQLKLDEG